jgi:hypothetical protein
MMTTRRNFLRLLAGAAIAPKVTYFLPPIGGWHSDVIAHPMHINYVHMLEIAAWPDCWKAIEPIKLEDAAKEFYEFVWIPWERLRNEKYKLGTIATDDSWLLRANS